MVVVAKFCQKLLTNLLQLWGPFVGSWNIHTVRANCCVSNQNKAEKVLIIYSKWVYWSQFETYFRQQIVVYILCKSDPMNRT